MTIEAQKAEKIKNNNIAVFLATLMTALTMALLFIGLFQLLLVK